MLESKPDLQNLEIRGFNSLFLPVEEGLVALDGSSYDNAFSQFAEAASSHQALQDLSFRGSVHSARGLYILLTICKNNPKIENLVIESGIRLSNDVLFDPSHARYRWPRLLPELKGLSRLEGLFTTCCRVLDENSDDAPEFHGQREDWTRFVMPFMVNNYSLVALPDVPLHQLEDDALLGILHRNRIMGKFKRLTNENFPLSAQWPALLQQVGIFGNKQVFYDFFMRAKECEGISDLLKHQSGAQEFSAAGRRDAIGKLRIRKRKA